MDLAGVRRAVLVPPSWEGDRNDVALEAAHAYPDRFAVMGRIALQEPASRALIDGWTTQPGMLGLRLTLHGKYYRPWLTDGTADWIWPAAERAGIPLMVFMPGALDHLDRIAAQHPGLKLAKLNLAPWLYEELRHENDSLSILMVFHSTLSAHDWQFFS
jgi:L-fuconolactonase